MGSDSNSGPPPGSNSSSPTTASPNAKRGRDPEDDLYVDNLHSHKRYLSEIMASSLNGLTVGDPLPDNLMESPARSDTVFYSRDDLSLQYSPMSEDSDDSRFCETPVHACSSQPDSQPSSPVSPHKYNKQFGGLSSAGSYSSNCGTVAGVANSQARQRSSDSESRFPSSPSDICHSADLRRAALMRSVQMRTQPHGSSFTEFPFGSVQESVPIIETEERPCPFMKSSPDDKEYQSDDCSPMGISETEFSQERSFEESTTQMEKDKPGQRYQKVFAAPKG